MRKLGVCVANTEVDKISASGKVRKKHKKSIHNRLAKRSDCCREVYSTARARFQSVGVAERGEIRRDLRAVITQPRKMHKMG